MDTDILTIIPTYNGEKYLGDTLESLADQSCPPSRVIVMDDGSTDNTCELVSNFTGLQCEWVGNSNTGSLANHRRGLNYCEQTQFLHFLHQDDLIHPEFYEAALRANNKIQSRGRSLTYCVPVRGENVSADDFRGHWNGKLSAQPARDFIWDRCKLGTINLSAVILKTEYRAPACTFGLNWPMIGDQVFLANWAAACDVVVRLDDDLCLYRTNPAGDSAHIVRNNLRAWVADELPAMLLMGNLMAQRKSAAAYLRLLYLARSLKKLGEQPRRGFSILRFAIQSLFTA